MADMNKSLSIIGWRDAVLARLEVRWPEMEHVQFISNHHKDHHDDHHFHCHESSKSS